MMAPCLTSAETIDIIAQEEVAKEIERYGTPGDGQTRWNNHDHNHCDSWEEVAEGGDRIAKPVDPILKRNRSSGKYSNRADYHFYVPKGEGKVEDRKACRSHSKCARGWRQKREERGEHSKRHAGHRALNNFAGPIRTVKYALLVGMTQLQNDQPTSPHNRTNARDRDKATRKVRVHRLSSLVRDHRKKQSSRVAA
jgi:hypothetical protein